MKIRRIKKAGGLNGNKRRKKKRFKYIVTWLKFLLTLALIVTIVLFAALSPVFNIKNITVHGSTQYKNGEIQALSGIKTGENGFKLVGSSLGNILAMRVGTAEKLLLDNCPYIKEVRVKYIIPCNIDISILDRLPLAVVSYFGTSIILDDEGYALDTVPPGKKSTLPEIKGLNIENFKLGKKVIPEKSKAFETALKVIGTVRDMDRSDTIRLYGDIDTVDVSNQQDVSITLDSRIVVNLGDLQDLNYRISMLKTIFSKNIKKSEKGTLDFTYGENPVFVPESGG